MFDFNLFNGKSSLKTSKLAGTTMYKSLLGDVLALKRAIVVSTFRKVYSVHPQDAKLHTMQSFKHHLV